MTNNELIAEWRGWEEICINSPDVVPGGEYTWLSPADGEEYSHVDEYDTDITLWHGRSGILTDVERRGLTDEFVEAVYEIVQCEIFAYSSNPSDHKFAFLMLSAAQLAAALVKMIAEE